MFRDGVLIIPLLMPNIQRDEFPPPNLFHKQMEQIDATKMRKPIGVEFDLDFLCAISHATKAYIMDGFVATPTELLKSNFYW